MNLVFLVSSREVGIEIMSRRTVVATSLEQRIKEVGIVLKESNQYYTSFPHART